MKYTFEIYTDPENYVLDQYKVTYRNGVTQILNLIRHERYLDTIKPWLYEIDDLERAKKHKEAVALKAKMKKHIGENWFTTRSPIYDAAKTGFLVLPESQGGKQKCSVSLIVIPLTKESRYELQRIDCNCNDCGFMKRDLSKPPPKETATPISHGECLKFGKPVSFIPMTCQPETQFCFVHRKDYVHL
jgi:hypothetical protein